MGRAAGSVEELALPAPAETVVAELPPALAEPTFDLIDSAVAHFRRYAQDEFCAEILDPATPTMITTQEELEAMVAEIEALETPTLALDCEISNMEMVPSEREIPDGQGGMKTVPSDDLVGGELRLVQLAVHSPSNGIGPKQWMIDCSRVDATMIAPLLSDKKIQKVIHYADFEQKQLMEKLNLEQPIFPIYDTCRAWMSVQKALRERSEEQRAEIGFEHWERYKNELRHLCAHLLGFTLAKDERLSDWAADPLSEEQLRYAVLDVAVLLPVASRIKYVVRKLEIEKKVRAHLYRANKEVVSEILAARAAA